MHGVWTTSRTDYIVVQGLTTVENDVCLLLWSGYVAHPSLPVLCGAPSHGCWPFQPWVSELKEFKKDKGIVYEKKNQEKTFFQSNFHWIPNPRASCRHSPIHLIHTVNPMTVFLAVKISFHNIQAHGADRCHMLCEVKSINTSTLKIWAKVSMDNSNLWGLWWTYRLVSCRQAEIWKDVELKLEQSLSGNGERIYHLRHPLWK